MYRSHAKNTCLYNTLVYMIKSGPFVLNSKGVSINA